MTRMALAYEAETALRAEGHNATLALGGEDTGDAEEGETLLGIFTRAAVDAFFDNDLLWSTRLFMRDAKGSFGLCVSCSLDALRQARAPYV